MKTADNIQSVQPPRLRGKLILAGVLFYLLFLLMQMPVSWLIAQLPSDSPAQLRQASGTPWNGSVRQVTWKVDNEQLELGQLTWRLIPSELLDGRIGLRIGLASNNHKLSGTLLIAEDGLQLKGFQGSLEATILGFVSRPLSLLQPKGSLELDIASLNLKRNRVHGAARLDWLNARSGLIGAPLGNYRAELTANPDGRRARINIHTRQGALAINGDGDFIPGKGVEGKLSLTPPQDDSRQLYTPVLNLLGRPNANGTWILALTPK